MSGCVSTRLTDALSVTYTDIPASIELVDVPFFPQKAYWCGPAALATVLQHAGVSATPEQLAGEVYLPERKGSLQMELLAAGRARDRLIYVLEADIEAVLREVAAGNPVLVLQNLGLKWLPRWHYAVVVGFDLVDGAILLRSGSERRWQTPLSVFDRTWARGGRWAAVLLKPEIVPATAAPDRFVRAALDLESTGKLQAAHRAFTSAGAKWPTHFTTQFALGNVAYRLGELRQAETALRRAAMARPHAAPAWNNLAYVLAAQGCADTARAAAQCAAARAPQDPGVADTQRTLAAAQNSATETCQAVSCPGLPDLSSPKEAVTSHTR